MARDANFTVTVELGEEMKKFLLGQLESIEKELAECQEGSSRWQKIMEFMTSQGLEFPIGTTAPVDAVIAFVRKCADDRTERTVLMSRHDDITDLLGLDKWKEE